MLIAIKEKRKHGKLKEEKNRRRNNKEEINIRTRRHAKGEKEKK